MLGRAIVNTYQSNKKEAEGADILEAILAEGDTFAAQLLQENGLTLEMTKSQVLERYMAIAEQDEQKIEQLLRKMSKKEATADSVPSDHVTILDGSAGQSKDGDAGFKRYVLRVTGEDAQIIGFKAAVSHDDRLELYIEETPFETELLASSLTILFETIDGRTPLKVELVTEMEGQYRVVSGFEDSSGIISRGQRESMIR